jgi:hypothetical protein
MVIAEPVPLSRPVPGFSSIATTLRRWTVAAIAIVLSSDRSSTGESRVSYDKIAAASRASGSPEAAPPAAIVDAAVTGAAGSSATTTGRTPASPRFPLALE